MRFDIPQQPPRQLWSLRRLLAGDAALTAETPQDLTTRAGNYRPTEIQEAEAARPQWRECRPARPAHCRARRHSRELQSVRSQGARQTEEVRGHYESPHEREASSGSAWSYQELGGRGGTSPSHEPARYTCTDYLCCSASVRSYQR